MLGVSLPQNAIVARRDFVDDDFISSIAPELLKCIANHGFFENLDGLRRSRRGRGPWQIVLVPPLELTLWRQRHPADFLAADQITAHVVYDNCAARLQRDHDPLSKRSTTWPEE